MSITDDYRRTFPKAKVLPAIVVALGLRFPVQVDAIYNNKRLGLQGTTSKYHFEKYVENNLLFIVGLCIH